MPESDSPFAVIQKDIPYAPEITGDLAKYASLAPNMEIGDSVLVYKVEGIPDKSLRARALTAFRRAAPTFHFRTKQQSSDAVRIWRLEPPASPAPGDDADGS